ncbi:uncharacterized protein M6B38_311835 [Iris pallida]|uniref:Uncharacterized protein n=1 Tax=Iris pallida TaxID=29817 RepID=A0AAX6HG50_IRIPA|nr:uncharacterized protein M6B38_311835 [Iris pallida]
MRTDYPSVTRNHQAARPRTIPMYPPSSPATVDDTHHHLSVLPYDTIVLFSVTKTFSASPPFPPRRLSPSPKSTLPALAIATIIKSCPRPQFVSTRVS